MSVRREFEEEQERRALLDVNGKPVGPAMGAELRRETDRALEAARRLERLVAQAFVVVQAALGLEHPATGELGTARALATLATEAIRAALIVLRGEADR